MTYRTSRIKKSRILLVVIAVIAVITAVGRAYYLRNSGEIKNIFTPADSRKPEVVEDFNDKKVKSNVRFYVGETGYPVYVRVDIVYTWKDIDGVVYFAPPKPEDYNIVFNLTDDGWELGDDGYYYYKLPIDSGKMTPVLIEQCTQINTPYKGYTLSVDIIIQTVQAPGKTDGENNKPEIDAYKDAWGIS